MAEMLKISREAKAQIIYDIENGELIQAGCLNEKWYLDEARGYDIYVSIDLSDFYRVKNATIVVENDGEKFELDQDQADEIYECLDETVDKAIELSESEASFRSYLWSCCLHM